MKTIPVYQQIPKNPGNPQSRWPFTSYPKSWYAVAHTDSLASGEVKPLQYFGQDLVLYRTEDGEAQLLDAFCPHMGAHLGHGGKVEGDDIRCPFHAWKFDGQGQCTEVPYGTKIPGRAKIQPWQVAEKNGFIFAWNDIEGHEPAWELPDVEEVGSGDWHYLQKHQWFIKSHCLEMGENQVDTAHFRYLHGVPDLPENELTIDGPVMNSRSQTDMTTPTGLIESVIESTNWGFGFSKVQFSGLTDLMILSSMTPMDGEQVHVRFDFLTKDQNSQDEQRGVGRAFMEEVVRQFEQDLEIWEHKIYIQPPNLCDGDGPVPTYRRWAAQFFPGGKIIR